jgi:hypothetical protein
MLGLPVRTRKRDKLKGLLQPRSATSQHSPQTSGVASTVAHVQGPALPSTSSLPPVVSPTTFSTHRIGVSTPIAAPGEATPPGPSTSTPPARDLWLDALQTLTKGEQNAVRNMQPMGPAQHHWSDTLEELVSLTREKQQECENGSYEFKFQGKKLILRDVAEKIVYWLSKFKDIGDIAVNFDPVHASLPWAGVRFLLQVLINPTDQDNFLIIMKAAVAGYEQMGALLVSIEKVTCITDRCAIYESLYRPETTPERVLRNLYSALVKQYAEILRLIALSHRLFAKNSASQALHALINPSEVSGLVVKCQELEAGVDIEAQNCERARNREGDTKAQELLEKTQVLLESLRKPIIRTDERVSHFLEKVEEKELLEVLDWISKILYRKNHDSVREQRTKDTCEWLLRRKSYLEWQDTSSSLILWLHGTGMLLMPTFSR